MGSVALWHVGSPQARDWTHISCTGSHILYHWVTSEILEWFSFIYLFYFTILYWFCHTLTWICHEYTCIPHPECPSHLPPHPIPLGHPSAPAPRMVFLMRIIWGSSIRYGEQGWECKDWRKKCLAHRTGPASLFPPHPQISLFFFFFRKMCHKSRAEWKEFSQCLISEQFNLLREMRD